MSPPPSQGRESPALGAGEARRAGAPPTLSAERLPTLPEAEVPTMRGEVGGEAKEAGRPGGGRWAWFLAGVAVGVIGVGVLWLVVGGA